MSRKSMKIKVGIVILIFLLLIGLPLIMGKSKFGLSTRLEITNFYFCEVSDWNVNGYSKIESISIHKFKDEIYICGNAITDGRPASIDILVYETKNQNNVFELPVGETVSTGFFSYNIPKNSINKIGRYTAQIIHGRPLPISADILIQP